MTKEWRPGDGLDAALEVLDGPSHTASDFIPTVHQTEPVATYRDWDPATTKVIRCCISNSLYPGERYESRDEAYKAVQARHGRILEANYVPGQAFFRVKK